MATKMSVRLVLLAMFMFLMDGVKASENTTTTMETTTTMDPNATNDTTTQDGGADAYFSEEEMMAWSGTEAVRWILGAGHAFEVLGLRPKKFGQGLLRRRFLRLSLLTHPDKNPHEEAAAAFRKLSESMRTLTTDGGQEELLESLFPSSPPPELSSSQVHRYAGKDDLDEEETRSGAEDAAQVEPEPKRRRSLSEILQAQKRQSLGRPGRVEAKRVTKAMSKCQKSCFHHEKPQKLLGLKGGVASRWSATPTSRVVKARINTVNFGVAA
ncbi:unnamed protein product [Durusdinium trenchii]|uniref:J domain-containing protein n=1 Tax=Durusdinium trenchii TaxID=1381693 RepID=A0ABP0NPB8_9DINO